MHYLGKITAAGIPEGMGMGDISISNEITV